MEKMIKTGYGSIHAHVVGSGPAILLVHGYHSANDWHVWEHNVQALADIGLTVYALDMLGHGESGGEGVDHRRQAQALLDLMDAESLQTATIAGNSWGGTIALELVLRAPERVDRLILIDASGVGHYAEEQMETISCPTLVVWGEDDSVIPVVNAAWFGAAIPDCHVETIPGVTEQEGVPEWAGHHPMRFKPDEFNRIVTGFLQKGGPSAMGAAAQS